MIDESTSFSETNYNKLKTSNLRTIKKQTNNNQTDDLIDSNYEKLGVSIQDWLAELELLPRCLIILINCSRQVCI